MSQGLITSAEEVTEDATKVVTKDVNLYSDVTTPVTNVDTKDDTLSAIADSKSDCSIKLNQRQVSSEYFALFAMISKINPLIK